MRKAALAILIAGIGLCLISGEVLADKGNKINSEKLPTEARTITPVQTTETESLTPVTPTEIRVEEPAEAVESSNAGEQINWQVLSAGGITTSSGGGFRLGGTLGQLAAGRSTAGDLAVSHGFWQDFGSGDGDCDCHPGDANADGLINIGDAVYIVNFVFREGDFPIPYGLCSGDAQADCFCNVGDAVYIINYVFREGAYPFTCEQWRTNCGPDIYK